LIEDSDCKGKLTAIRKIKKVLFKPLIVGPHRAIMHGQTRFRLRAK